jgi:hypothetical protein
MTRSIVLAATLLLPATSAHADFLLYANGSGNYGQNNSFSYLSRSVVHDFSLAENSFLTRLVFNVYTTQATVAPTAAILKIFQNVAGDIGQELFGGEFNVADLGATGTSGSFTLKDFGVSLPSWQLGPGAYFLALEVDEEQFDFGWTITGGESHGGFVGGPSYIAGNAETGGWEYYDLDHHFRIYGGSEPVPVPLPATALPFAVGAFAIAAGRWWRNRNSKLVG